MMAGRNARFIDVTLRDGHQCLWSTRMTTAQMHPILNRIDAIGYDAINIMGGAVFDVMVRFLRENPWQRMKEISRHVSTPLDALTRGVSLYTFELFSDDIIALNSKVLAECGVSILTVYDALNDNDNIRSSVSSARSHGLKVNAMITYALSPVHTDEYFVARLKELRALRVDTISVKDPTGLLTPDRARILFPKLKSAAIDTPLQLHSHCQTGLAPEVYKEAIIAGFEYFYTAAGPLANGASLPDTREVLGFAKSLGCEASISEPMLTEYESYWNWIAYRDGLPTGQRQAVDQNLYRHQIPGGMISNLRSQLSTMGIANRFDEILEETGRVREDLGYPILVSPFAQYIVTQAVLNVVQGDRYKSVPDEVKKYACGFYGRLAASPSDEFLNRADLDEFRKLKGNVPQRLPALPALRKSCGMGARDEDLLLAAFYPTELVSGLHRSLPTEGYSGKPLLELIRFCTKNTRADTFHIRMQDVAVTIST